MSSSIFLPGFVFLGFVAIAALPIAAFVVVALVAVGVCSVVSSFFSNGEQTSTRKSSTGCFDGE